MFSILKYRGALPFYFAVFLNAFIDLGHKITLQNIIFKVHDDAEQVVLTAIVNALILLPYVLFVVPVGSLANRTPKPVIMRFASLATVVLCCLLVCFYWLGWFWMAFATTFAMSTQSAFYSPAKLGYLKTLFGVEHLLSANGLAQSVVIVGILLGTVLFSLGFESLYHAQVGEQMSPALAKSAVMTPMWLLAVGLVALALLQLALVWRIPILDENNDTRNDPSRHEGGIKEQRSPNRRGAIKTRELLASHRFRTPMLGLALFWALGQAVLAIFPAFAKSEAQISNTAVIQSILACAGLGIFIGSWLVSQLENRKSNAGMHAAVVGMLFTIVGLFSLTWFDLAWIYALQFLCIGIACGLLVVPLNAFLQGQADRDSIGSVIATSNLLQNIAMLAVLAATIAIALFAVAPATILLVMAIVAALAAIYLVPALNRLG